MAASPCQVAMGEGEATGSGGIKFVRRPRSAAARPRPGGNRPLSGGSGNGGAASSGELGSPAWAAGVPRHGRCSRRAPSFPFRSRGSGAGGPIGGRLTGVGGGRKIRMSTNSVDKEVAEGRRRPPPGAADRIPPTRGRGGPQRPDSLPFPSDAGPTGRHSVGPASRSGQTSRASARGAGRRCRETVANGARSVVTPCAGEFGRPGGSGPGSGPSRRPPPRG